MSKAMVALTCVMGAGLALQFGGWLWVVNPRLLVVMVALAAFIIGLYYTWRSWRDGKNNQRKTL